MRCCNFQRFYEKREFSTTGSCPWYLWMSGINSVIPGHVSSVGVPVSLHRKCLSFVLETRIEGKSEMDIYT